MDSSPRPLPCLEALAREATAYAWGPGTALAWAEVVLVRLTPADAIPEWEVFVDGRRVECVTLAGSADDARATLERVLAPHVVRRASPSDRQLRSMSA